MLEHYKRLFLKSELHLNNEKSVTNLMHKISEPVIIIKKNKQHLRPRFQNTAAEDILPFEKELASDKNFDSNLKHAETFSSLGSDNDTANSSAEIKGEFSQDQGCCNNNTDENRKKNMSYLSR